MFAAAIALGACSNLLDVENPGAIVEDNLKDPQVIPGLVNGAVAEFQRAFDGVAFYGGIFTDELNDYQVFFEDRPIDLRDVTPSNGLLNSYVYTPLQRARAAGDHNADRLKSLLGDKASSSLDVARLLDYAGYSYLLLAETYCQAPIDVGKAQSPDDLFKAAIDRFNQAITIAAAARAAGASAASADSLTSLAHVGAARAALDRNDKATALTHAQAVPAAFQFWVTHSDNSLRENNLIYDATRTGNNYASVDPAFLNLNDPRVPTDTKPSAVAFNVSFFAWIPYQPSSYEKWNGQLTPLEKATSIRFASGLEAQYIAAEAQGPTAATLAFVNARRTVGKQAPVTLTGDALMAELRDQRRREFFLAGYRMGDLRRYKQFYAVDQFPTGVWPGDQKSVYSTTATCFPIPQSELNGNPNLGS
ncbi:MAG TPA: RagB/SusD family nutrient uptake outer membrane protein [Longimicrobiales bacterium]|nr:RagB/SusD family nutrient uptake outer membrane protein [Longimicrobiales bacterium]